MIAEDKEHTPFPQFPPSAENHAPDARFGTYKAGIGKNFDGSARYDMAYPESLRQIARRGKDVADLVVPGQNAGLQSAGHLHDQRLAGSARDAERHLAAPDGTFRYFAHFFSR